MPTKVRKKIMVVEDDRNVRDYIFTLIDRLGYNSATFDSAESAMESFDGNPSAYSCAILDIWLEPGMDGFQLYKHITARLPGFPVLFCTGLTDKNNVEKLKAHGDYLKKEFWAKDGVEAIERLVRKAG